MNMWYKNKSSLVFDVAERFHQSIVFFILLNIPPLDSNTMCFYSGPQAPEMDK